MEGGVRGRGDQIAGRLHPPILHRASRDEPVSGARLAANRQVRKALQGAVMFSQKSAVIAAALALAIQVPRRAAAFPWSVDMFRGDAVQPMDQAPRVMPSGTLPINGERPR